MFNPKFIDVLKRRNSEHAYHQGEPEMLSGGLRHRSHPLSYMAYQPATLSTGTRGRAGQPSIMNGGSFGSFARSMGRGIRQVGKELAPVVKDIGRQVIPIVQKAGKDFAMKKVGEFAAQYGPQIAEGAAMFGAGLYEEEDGGARILYPHHTAHHTKEFIRSHTPKHKPKPKRKVSSGDGRMRRAAKVREIMHKHGMGMIQASSYIKSHGISY